MSSLKELALLLSHVILLTERVVDLKSNELKNLAAIATQSQKLGGHVALRTMGRLYIEVWRKVLFSGHACAPDWESPNK